MHIQNTISINNEPGLYGRVKSRKEKSIKKTHITFATSHVTAKQAFGVELFTQHAKCCERWQWKQ